MKTRLPLFGRTLKLSGSAQLGLVLILIMLILPKAGSAQRLGAEENRSSQELSFQASSLPEAKLAYTRRFIIPFLEGESVLTQDNNISLSVSAELSPISVNGLTEIFWTPIAFFQLAAGGRIGSGWSISMFGTDIYGSGINRPDASGNMEHSGSAFDGLVWKAQTGGVLQFDLGAIFPGEWTHVVARTYHEINYKGYTAASSGESWYFENDLGENGNGFNYYGNMLLAYQMPLLLNTAGFLTEADLYLYDTKNRSAWGDDRIRWTFSALGNFTLTEKLSAALLVQFRTMRNYKESSWEDLYYRKRNLDTSNPLRLEFYRAAVILTYIL